jgi:hypothetical protein
MCERAIDLENVSGWRTGLARLYFFLRRYSRCSQGRVPARRSNVRPPAVVVTESDGGFNELHEISVALYMKLANDQAPGTCSRRLHNASTNGVDFGSLEWSPKESMKTSKVRRISSLTRNARVLASFETAAEYVQIPAPPPFSSITTGV